MTFAERPSKAEILGRIARLQENLAAQGLAAALLVQEIDRYYFTGTMQNGYVFIPAKGEPLLLLRKSAERGAEESPLDVVNLPTLRKLPELVKEAFGGTPENLGLTFDVLPVGQFDRVRGMFAGVELKDASHAVALTRSIKSPWEQAQISEAAKVMADTVAQVPTFLKSGMKEFELAARVEYELRLRGHGGFTPMRGFNQRLHYGHIFAGRTAAEAGGYDMPTVGLGLSPAVGQGSSTRAIEAGEPVVVDIVGHFNGYLCDQTRMFSIGPVEKEFLDAFEAAVHIQRTVADAAKPGVKAGELYALSEETARASGFSRHYLGEDYKVTFVGHGIGLEVDEYPFLAKGFDLPLKEGMVFALEPKFTFKGRAAVGVEDTYVVTAEGAKPLTLSPRVFTVV